MTLRGGAAAGVKGEMSWTAQRMRPQWRPLLLPGCERVEGVWTHVCLLQWRQQVH